MRVTTIGLAFALAAAPALAQQAYVYPQKGQSQEQLQKDQAECQQWAQGQTGVSPGAPAQGAAPGGRLRGTAGGAARGAAAGAAIGAIAGDAGKGAAIGATGGAFAGRRQAKQNEQAAQAAQGDAYNRAFAACMEGRGYSVK
jgi:hypothetical protein